MKIVFHGSNALTFREGLEALLESEHEIVELPDMLISDEDFAAFEDADVLVGVALNASLPAPRRLKLYQVPGAGVDGIDRSALPSSALLCNCFGHETAIAEYVMSALLSFHVPLADADRRLRTGDWKYWAGRPKGMRTELGDQSIGIVGFGHIGKAVAARAKAFSMSVSVANRSPIEEHAHVDTAYALDDLADFAGSVDIIVNTLPLTSETEGLIGAEAFARMRPGAIVVNVGRGKVIDEAALFSALREKRIGGAVIDTWYVYPDGGNSTPMPSQFAFQELDNVVMTPHMSGWTHGTISRRQKVIAENINRIASDQAPVNVVS
ncbi:2-hydroxyacid dehydrogenase [Aliiruegeria sabulilitoris]|uniref:2-hydroxyacid dehydrogenase n=1 Tax=Aliiruegeria sabulilitoris TaxID=1510458 RepID=UPI000829FD6A|nr:2-hydroxyacid dehydrogenase [Aliiruegeria sabulilitoris]NDR57742.1 phosphoglycerate dehydrogenase [Pseudoruegeria sp. M32A2M]